MTSPPREAGATPATDPTATTDRLEDPTVTRPTLRLRRDCDCDSARRVTRVRDLLARMTLAEKLSQIVGFWDKGDGEAVAPLQGDFGGASGLEEAARHGLGHLTRPYGTRPVDPVERAAWLWGWQRALVTGTRLGIPALVHEECLTGLAAWQAATFPTPLAWGAPSTRRSSRRWAPRSARRCARSASTRVWPRSSTSSATRGGAGSRSASREDPYLVGTHRHVVRARAAVGRRARHPQALRRLLRLAGRAQLRARCTPGRASSPTCCCRRSRWRCSTAARESVMHSYTEIDGVPVAADRELLTGCCASAGGSTAPSSPTTSASPSCTSCTASRPTSATPPARRSPPASTSSCRPATPTSRRWPTRCARGRSTQALVDRAVLRVLTQKEELGPARRDVRGRAAAARSTSTRPSTAAWPRRLAEESVVLLANDGTLPLAARRRVAVIGPERRPARGAVRLLLLRQPRPRPAPRHRDRHRGPDRAARRSRAELGRRRSSPQRGLRGRRRRPSRLRGGRAPRPRGRRGRASSSATRPACSAAAPSGEGCDRDDLELPGVQRELVEAVLDTGTPVVLVLLTGRPYAVGWALERCAAVVQAFFPGEEGGAAMAGVLSGRVNPSGRLPVSMPRSAGAQPYTLPAPAARRRRRRHQPRAARPPLPFGHGLSYTTFRARPSWRWRRRRRATAGRSRAVRVTNTGDRGRRRRRAALRPRRRRLA